MTRKRAGRRKAANRGQGGAHSDKKPKAKGAGSRRPIADGRSHPERRPAPDKDSPLAKGSRATVLVVAASIAFFLVFGYDALVPLLIVPLVVGCLFALVWPQPLEAAGLAAASGLGGAALSAALYGQKAWIGFVSSMPKYANPDVVGSLYERVLWPLVQGNPVNSTSGAFATIVVSAMVAGGTAFGLALSFASAGSGTSLKRAVSWSAVALIAVSFAYSASGSTAELRGLAGTEPALDTYSYDAMIYVKTVYLMKGGQDYYSAVVDAAEGDSRFKASGAVKDDKMYGFWPKPSYFRQPLPFYLWKYASLGSAAGVVTLSLIVSASLLVGLYWAFERHMSYRALLVCMVAYPMLFLSTTWLNVFFPDWWASLGTLVAVVFLVRGLPLPAAAAAWFAAMCRFTAVPLLLLMLGLAVVAAWRGDRKKWLTVAGTCVGLLALFGAFYVLHLRAATPYVDAATMKAQGMGGIMSGASQRPFTEKTLPSASYMMYPYGFFDIPVLLVYALSLAGWFLSLAKDRYAEFAVGGYAAAWLAFILVIGATASYWGQMFTPLVAVGAGALLAAADSGVLRIAARRPAATAA